MPKLLIISSFLLSFRQHQSGVAPLLSFRQHQSGVASLLSFRQHQISGKIAAFLGFPLFCNFWIQKKGLRILNLIEMTLDLFSFKYLTHSSCIFGLHKSPTKTLFMGAVYNSASLAVHSTPEQCLTLFFGGGGDHFQSQNYEQLWICQYHLFVKNWT